MGVHARARLSCYTADRTLGRLTRSPHPAPARSQMPLAMRPSVIAATLLLACMPGTTVAQNRFGETRCFRFDKPYFGYPNLTTPIVALTPVRHPEPRLGSEGRVLDLPTLRPDSAERERRQLYSGWAPLHRDSVIVVWRNAFAGYRMRLAVRGDSLVGIGRFLTDSQPRAVRPGRVRAVRTSCPSA